MAKPDLDGGYMRIANELAAALACADVSKYARIVLHEVFSQIFGPTKKKVASIVPSELTKRYDMDKSNLRRSVRELIDSGILIHIKDYDYRFNKDYESWTEKGVPRLSEMEVVACKKATENVFGNKNSLVVSPDNSHTTDANVSVVKLTSKSGQIDNHPIIEDRAGNRIKEKKKEKNNTGRVDGDFPYPERDGFLMIMPGPHPENEVTARQIFRRAWDKWKNEKICTGFYEHQRWFSPEVWIAAFRDVVSRNVDLHAIGYVEKVAAGIEKNGIKTEAKPESTIKAWANTSRSEPSGPEYRFVTGIGNTKGLSADEYLAKLAAEAGGSN